MAKKTDLFYPDRVVNGQLVSRAARETLRELEDQQVEWCIRPRRNYTSHPQRGWYRGIIIRMITIELRARGIRGPHGGPITDEQVHQMLAQRFLRESVLIDEETGECMDIVLSTGGSDMTAGRMADYCEECRAWARETLDLDIPDPEQVAGRRIAMR